jgi:hypothetical protein
VRSKYFDFLRLSATSQSKSKSSSFFHSFLYCFLSLCKYIFFEVLLCSPQATICLGNVAFSYLLTIALIMNTNHYIFIHVGIKSKSTKATKITLTLYKENLCSMRERNSSINLFLNSYYKIVSTSKSNGIAIQCFLQFNVILAKLQIAKSSLTELLTMKSSQ